MKIVLSVLGLLFISAQLMCAEEVKKEDTKADIVELSKPEALDLSYLENIAEQASQQAMQPVYQRLKELYEKYKLSPKEYGINIRTGQFVKRPTMPMPEEKVNKE
jgi:hypothetical protein